MKVKLEHDTFVYNGTMAEDFSGGAWFEEDLPAETKDKGLLFPPNTNVTYAEFKKEKDHTQTYCITWIDQKDRMRSKTGLTYSDAAELVKKLQPILNEKNPNYLSIFRQKDAISFNEYVKTLDR